MTTNTEKMINLYQTNENLFKTILSMYKLIKCDTTPIRVKLETIEPLLDFCYIYFVHHYDITFPSIKLPSTRLKLQLMTSRLRGCSLKIVDLFDNIIIDKHYKLLIQQPPTYLTGEKTEEELHKILIHEIVKKIRIIIDALLLLKPNSN